MSPELLELEPIDDEDNADPIVAVRSRVEVRHHRLRVLVVALVLAGLAGRVDLLDVGSGSAAPAGGEAERATDPAPPDIPLSGELLDPLDAAARFVAAPDRDRLHALFEAVGGFEGLRSASAVGAFDVVTFDPAQPDVLLASKRLSYGPAQNQLVNQRWRIDPSAHVEQTLWASAVEHDFVHFNIDGTVTMWVHGGGDGFAPRRAVVLDGVDGEEILTTTPLYASRFTATSDAVFALTGNGVYGTTQSGYADLVADRGDGPIVLADGASFSWIDNPTPDILVAYPADPEGVTAVWDAATWEPLPSHPLANHAYRRVGVSGDRRTAVAASTEGPLEIIDLTTGRVRGRFGHLDVTGVGKPITLDHDGTVAITTQRSGLVQIWWVGDDDPVATVDADAAQPRWISPEYAPRSTSVVSPDGSRLALRVGARPGVRTRWDVVETDVTKWIARACRLAEGSPEPATSRMLRLHRRAC